MGLTSSVKQETAEKILLNYHKLDGCARGRTSRCTRSAFSWHDCNISPPVAQTSAYFSHIKSGVGSPGWGHFSILDTLQTQVSLSFFVILSMLAYGHTDSCSSKHHICAQSRGKKSKGAGAKQTHLFLLPRNGSFSRSSSPDVSRCPTSVT